MSSVSVISSLRWPKGRSTDVVAPALLEFQSPSSAVISAPIPVVARGTVWVITSLVVVLIVLAAVMPVDQVVTARGLVVSQSPNVLVQPLETAIVRSIDVREGQTVTKGQLLARLDPTFADADQAAVAAQTSALEAEVARLTAEVEGKPFEYLGSDPDWTLQVTLMGHRKAVYDAKLETFDRQLDELTLVVSRARSDADGYRERLGVASSIEDMRKELEETQTGSRLNTLLAEDNRAEMARSLSNSSQTAEAAERQQAAVAAERNAFIQAWRAETAQSLSEATSRFSEARELLNKADLRKELVELRSDSDAIVQSVARVSVGSVLQSGERLITLVPTGGTLGDRNDDRRTKQRLRACRRSGGRQVRYVRLFAVWDGLWHGACR